MLRRLPALLLPAALLLGGTAACSGDDGGGSGDAGGRSTTSTTEPARLDPPEVELVDAGAEPRVAVRLDPAEDCASSTTTRQQDVNTIDSGEGEPTVRRSDVEVDVTSVCTSVTDDEIEYVTTYDDIRAPDDPTNAELYAALRDTQVTTTVDRRGNILGLVTESGESMVGGDDEQAQQIQQSAVPFPAEPVGLGAVWRIRSERRADGIPSTSVSEYTVTRLDGPIVEVGVRSTLTYTKGPFQLSTANGDVPSELLGGGLEGTGTMRWDLTQVTTTSDISIVGSSRMRVMASDGTFEVDQSQEQHVVVTDRPTP